MPVSAAANVAGSWEQVRNILNLKPLLDNNYCDAGHLNCPGSHHANGSSYSYQWQRPGRSLRWGDARAVTVVLGDRNPLIDAAERLYAHERGLAPARAREPLAARLPRMQRATCARQGSR